MKRQIVLVSGSPAAGKTSLARPLTKLLDLPLIAKDDIKETLVDGLGDQNGDLAWSHKVGGASMELLWKLAGRAPLPSWKRTSAPTATTSASD